MDHAPSQTSPTPPLRRLEAVGRTVLGSYLTLLSILLAYLVYEIWPTAEPDASGRIPDTTITLFGDLIELTVSAELRLILLVMVVGALGSYVHAATSFANYVGNRRLELSWGWWYILRPFIGLSLALVFYFVIRGGLFSTGARTADISTFGIAAVSGLVGMFSKQAISKLKELFDNLFKAEELEDRLTSPVPAIVTIEPSTVQAGRDLSLTVNGSHFLRESRVRFKGEDRPTTFVSATRLRVHLSASDLASPGEAEVTIFNPPPGGGTSNTVTLKIEEA